MNKNFVLDLDELLDRAERDYILDDKESFCFPVRKKAGIENYYQLLDAQVLATPGLKIVSYRPVKEGYTKVSRPAEIGFGPDYLTRHRPAVVLAKKELLRLERLFQGTLSLRDFARINYVETMKDLSVVEAGLDVLRYLIQHRDEVVGLLPRQVAHGKSTKLIGKESLLLRLFAYWLDTTVSGGLQESVSWKDFYAFFGLQDMPPEFRVFAPTCRWQGHSLKNFEGVIARDWMSDADFSNLTGTLILENFSTFYGLKAESRKTLLVWGGGWRAVGLSRLWSILPKPIYYWGDIDKEGFEIFAYLKKSNPELRPLLMGAETLKKYQHLVQKKEVYLGPFRETFELQSIYEEVSLKGLQIEQEQLAEAWPLAPGLE